LTLKENGNGRTIAPSPSGANNHLRDHYKGKVNIENAHIYASIRKNIRRQLPQIGMDPRKNPQKAMMICGGPSTTDYLDEIKRRKRQGWKIVTLNNAHNWAREQGFKVGAQIMLDARPYNVRFVAEPIDGCRYLIASQCDPSIFEALKDHEVFLWHAAGEEEQKILDPYYQKRYIPIQGGTTVGSRALWLLYTLGFRKIAIYGMDSCIRNKKQHHAYKQPENDAEIVHKLRIGRRIFWAHPWMTVQCDELLQMLPMLPNDLLLQWKGDGLIPHVMGEILKHGKPPKLQILDEGKLLQE